MKNFLIQDAIDHLVDYCDKGLLTEEQAADIAVILEKAKAVERGTISIRLTEGGDPCLRGKLSTYGDGNIGQGLESVVAFAWEHVHCFLEWKKTGQAQFNIRDTCPHCGTTELLCGWGGPGCSSVQTGGGI